MKTSFGLSALLSQGLFLAFLPVWFMLFSYLHPVVIVVVWATLTTLVFLIVYGFRQDTIHISAKFLKWIMALYTAALLILLFFRPSNQAYENMNLIPFHTIRLFLSGEADAFVAFYNIAANVVLFVPYGMFWMLTASPSLLQKTLVPVLVITLIELVQFVTHRGSLDIDDLILNVAGVFLGYALYPLGRRVLRVIR
ncbi:VanZ family protein [Domibacillus sp. PGB-M46]|uniref:VanZ family protein n=1 Tax=Domibacillus sp. PGB-M46 TaxID=2910255 RepID=UPI001F583B9A|nr:VanZ family protein [Domibacillus sp. PGB-M46]MCI2252776.1 VanZ family protein [Domibacillus sp. PGB-M46]